MIKRRSLVPAEGEYVFSGDTLANSVQQPLWFVFCRTPAGAEDSSGKKRITTCKFLFCLVDGRLRRTGENTNHGVKLKSLKTRQRRKQ